MQYIKNFIKYVINPKNSNSTKKNLKIKNLGVILTLILFFKLLFSIIFNLIYNIPSNEKFDNIIQNNNIIYVFFIGVIIAPVLEEIAFRLPLKFYLKNFCFSLSILIFFFINSFYLRISNFKIDDTFIYRFLFSITVGIIVWFILKNNKEKLTHFMLQKFKYIFYFYSVLFSVFHISNYNIENEKITVLIILAFPHLISAFLYGYIRMIYGFYYCVLMHIINNLFYFILFILSNLL